MDGTQALAVELAPAAPPLTSARPGPVTRPAPDSVGTGPLPRPHGSRRPALQAVLLLALALAVRAPSFVRPFWSPDEGYLATEAVALRHGGHMYADVVDRKPPLVPWLYEACFGLAGADSLWLVRVCAVLALAVTALFVARLAAAWGEWAALPAGVLTIAASAALPAPDAMAATFEIFMLPATAAAMYFGSRRRYLLAGLAVAVATLTKQVGLAPLLPLAVQVIASPPRYRLRRGAALVVGVLVPVLGCALLTGPRPFAFWVFLSSGSYAASPPGVAAICAHVGAGLVRLGVVFAAFALVLPRLRPCLFRRLRPRLLSRLLPRFLRRLLPRFRARPTTRRGGLRALGDRLDGWIVADDGARTDGGRGTRGGGMRIVPGWSGGGTGSGSARRPVTDARLGNGSSVAPRVPDGSERSLWLWLLASVAGVSVGFHFYGHYFLQLVPPLALLAIRAVGAVGAVDAGSASWREPGDSGMARVGTVDVPAARGNARVPSTRSRAVAARVPSLLSLQQTPVVRRTRRRLLPRAGRPRIAAVTVGCALAVSAALTGSALGAEPPQMGKSLTVAAAVDTWSRPGQSVYLWGMHPEEYWLANRAPASRYLTAGLLTNFSGGGNIHQVGAEYAVPGAWPTFGREMAAAPPCLIVDESAGTPYPMADYPSLAQLVARSYLPVAQVQGAQVYRRTGC
jgi:hypothetical protein